MTLAKQDPLTLQGSLFGTPEPSKHSAQVESLESSEGEADLTDQDLSDNALARPRRKTSSSTPAAVLTSDDEIDKASPNDDSTDEPAWAHHSQLKPEQLTPVLRHYVELKMECPKIIMFILSKKIRKNYLKIFTFLIKIRYVS